MSYHHRNNNNQSLNNRAPLPLLPMMIETLIFSFILLNKQLLYIKL